MVYYVLLPGTASKEAPIGANPQRYLYWLAINYITDIISYQ